MERGNISNRVVPKLLLIFEGALGKVPEEHEKEFTKAYKREKWKKAVSLWDLNEPLCWQITRVFMKDHTIEVVTFLDEGFAEELAVRLQDKEELPVHKVWASEPHILARKVTMMNDVKAVYDPDPARRFLYGGKGRVLERVGQFGA